MTVHGEHTAWGLGRPWGRTGLVQKLPVLR